MRAFSRQFRFLSLLSALCAFAPASQIAVLLAADADTSAPTSLYDLTGFAIAGATAPREIAADDPASRRVASPAELTAALRDAGKVGAPVRVIEITADIDCTGVSIPEIGAQPQTPEPMRRCAAGLTLFSTSGATLRNAALTIKNAANITIRNLRFENTRGDNPAPAPASPAVITLGDGAPASDIWIDHCTFSGGASGVVDIQPGAREITLSWCRIAGDGETPDAPAGAISIGAPDAALPERAKTNVTLHHLLVENIAPRAISIASTGNVHAYNLYIDNTHTCSRSGASQPLRGIAAPDSVILLEKSVCMGARLANRDARPETADGRILILDTICQLRSPGGRIATTRGNNIDASSPFGCYPAPRLPFAWNLSGGSLPYAYTADDPSELSAILAAGAGSGVVSWRRESWLKTSYATPAADRPPSIIVQPAPQTAAPGGCVVFTVAVSGSPQVTYQWFKDNIALEDETHSTLTLANVNAADAGNYHVVVSNDLDTLTSNAVTLTIEPAPKPGPQRTVMTTGIH